MKQQILTVIICLFLAGCSSIGRQIPVRQGNVVTPTMVAQLKPGMTKKQVLYVMGAPLLEAPFTHNSWDYLYFQKLNHGSPQSQRITLEFSNNRLKRIVGKLNPQLNLKV